MAGPLGAEFHREAVYVMAALTDEMFLHLDWEGVDFWLGHLFEARFFHSNLAGEQFFLRIEQLLLRDDEPADAVHDLFAETLFGDTPLGRSVLGSTESIEALSRDDVHGWYRGRYTMGWDVVRAERWKRIQALGLVRGRLSGFDRSSEAMRLSVPAAIRWEMIKWAKAQGYRWFDFGGLRPETLAALLDSSGRGADELPTADQPKVTFGGTAFRYPTPVEMIRPAALRMAYDLAWRSETGWRLFREAQSLLRGSRRRGRDATASPGASTDVSSG